MEVVARYQAQLQAGGKIPSTLAVRLADISPNLIKHENLTLDYENDEPLIDMENDCAVDRLKHFEQFSCLHNGEQDTKIESPFLEKVCSFGDIAEYSLKEEISNFECGMKGKKLKGYLELNSSNDFNVGADRHVQHPYNISQAEIKREGPLSRFAGHTEDSQEGLDNIDDLSSPGELLHIKHEIDIEDDDLIGRVTGSDGPLMDFEKVLLEIKSEASAAQNSSSCAAASEPAGPVALTHHTSKKDQEQLPVRKHVKQASNERYNKEPSMTSRLHCEFCLRMFRTKKYLNLHVKTHTDKDFRCKVFRKKFARTKLSNSLIRIQTDCKSFACNLSEKDFSSSEYLKEHSKTHTGEGSFECDVCKKKFTHSSKLKLLTRTHTTKRPFECDVCEKKFTSSSSLKRHTRTHTGERPFKCDLCKKKFIQRQHLNDHSKTHTGERPFECNVCKKTFSQRFGLIKHTRIHTGERAFECDVCEKKFTHSSNLKLHTRTHTGKRPFVCDVCEKKFTSSSNLKRHTRTHTGERLFKCDLCEKKFIQRQHLNNHSKTHTGERPFKCDLCDKKFIQRQHLNDHSKTHTGERPFECDVCKKTFIQRSGLIKHTRIHTGERAFECDVCEKKFNRNSHLTRHKRTHIGKVIWASGIIV